MGNKLFTNNNLKRSQDEIKIETATRSCDCFLRNFIFLNKGQTENIFSRKIAFRCVITRYYYISRLLRAAWNHCRLFYGNTMTYVIPLFFSHPRHLSQSLSFLLQVIRRHTHDHQCNSLVIYLSHDKRFYGIYSSKDWSATRHQTI